MNILEVNGLNKSYRDFSLEDVCFTVPEGCITGFIGINGAGKTTTIKALLGLTRKASGTVKVFGQDFDSNELELKNRIGVVLDEGYFYDDLTMEEMKSIIAPAYSNWNEAEFKGYMERFSLNKRSKIATLSRGMRMKFALALALSHGAELLIMDEPTSGLDPLIRSQLLDMMTEFMRRGGKGILFSTHITSDLDKIADMLVLIDSGRIVFEQEKDAMLERHRLVKGDKKALNDTIRKLFLHIRTTDYGFAGLTDRLPQVKQLMPDALAEKVSIEDVMLSYVGGGNE